MCLGNQVEHNVVPNKFGVFSTPSLEEKCYCYKLLLNFQFYDNLFLEEYLDLSMQLLSFGNGEVKYLVSSFADFQNRLFILVLSYGISATYHVVFLFTGFT